MPDKFCARLVIVCLTTMIISLLTVPLLAAAESPTPAKEVTARRKVKVGVNNFPPFIIAENGDVRGFTLDFFEAIAREMDMDYELLVYPGVSELLNAVEAEEVDLAMSGITVTSKREERVDFAFPYFDTGLDIMVRNTSGETDWQAIKKDIFSGNKLTIIIAFFSIVLVGGHLIWLLERNTKNFKHAYLPGIFEGIYWSLVTASTVGYGDKVPRRTASRVVALMMILMALPLFGLFTADLASMFTVQRIRQGINGPEDLARHVVAVVDGTTSQASVRKFNATTRVYDTADEAYAGLLHNEVAAFVYDQPTLMWYAHQHPDDNVRVVGKRFEPQDFAAALPTGSPMMESLNLTIIELMETGEYWSIRDRWFKRN